jgi:uncharacterized protein (TIGR03067 family)
MRTRASLLFTALLLVAAAPAALRDDDAKKDLDKLQGEWIIVSMERDGQQMPKEQLEGFKRTVKGDEYTVTRNGETLAQGKYKLDPTKKPKAIDAMTKNQEGQDVTMQGIYEFDGDNYKVCFAMPGQPRPTEFKTSENSGRTLTVSKKAGK